MVSKIINFLDEKITDKNIQNNIPKICSISLILLLIFSLPVNLYNISIDDIIKQANADSLPIKVMQDRGSETWLLPDGNFVMKSGGEAKTNFFDNQTDSWKSSKTTAIDGDSFKVQSGLISTLFDDKIIHYDMNMTTPISRETPMLYHKVDKNDILVPLTLQERTISISSEPSYETVAGITVNDPIEITNVNERYSTEFGDFLIKYTYKDGMKLKHTFTLVPSVSNELETFYFVHDFEMLNYNKEETSSDKIEVIADITKEKIEPMITDKEITDGKFDEVVLDKAVDLKTIRLVESETGELVDELNSNESLVLTKTELLTVNTNGQDSAKVTIIDGNNNFLLGEVIAETSSAPSWEKFKEAIMDNTQENPHIRFVYGDWIGGFELDPDTYSSNNPTIDGFITDNDDAGANTCNEGNDLTTGSTNLRIGTNDASSTFYDCWYSFLEYDISSIADTNTILSVDFSFDTDSINTPLGNDYVALETTRGSDTAGNIWTQCDTSATVFLNNNTVGDTVGVHNNLDLGTDAKTDVQDHLSLDYWGFCIKPDNKTVQAGVSHEQSYDSEEGATKPTLQIIYSSSTPPSVPLNPIIYINDTSQALFDWDSPTDCLNCGGFTVWNATDGTIINNSTDSSITKYQLSGLTSGKILQLKVSAWNATGTGTNSSTITSYTINTAPILDDVNVINSTAFELFYTINGTFNGIQVNTDEFPYASFSTFLANSTSSAVSFIINGTGVAIDTAIKIFAHNQGGTSLESNQIINATSTPEVPVLTSSAQTTTTVTLVMASNYTGSSYNISKSPSGCASLISLINSTTTPYVATDLSLGTQYCFQAFSVNAYGNSTGSNLLNVTTSTNPVTVGGGGGSSGTGTTTTITNALLLNLNSKSFLLSLGEKRTYSLDLIWDETKEFSLYVKSISMTLTGLDSLSIQPEIIPTDGKKIINGKGEVLFNIDVPIDKCDSIQQTARCVNIKTYAVPVKVTVSDVLGTVYSDIPAVITITITDKFPIGLWIIIGLSLAMIWPIYKIMKKASQKDKRPKPKDIEKNHKKAMKQIHKNDMKKVRHNNSIFKRLKSL